VPEGRRIPREDKVHPYIGQALAAERVRDWQRQAAQARRAKQARRARRSIAEIFPERRAGRRQTWEIGPAPGTPIREPENAASDHRHPVGAGRG
jgi:hypothetical protein